ncbi:MAG: D-alanine--D-alanine ligase family protein [Candidatus Nanopelagicales bacterium]
MAKINVALVFGGRSSEHAISCVTAGNVLAAIDRSTYDVTPIGISTDGQWLLQSGGEQLAITDGQLPEIREGAEVTLTSVPGAAVRLADSTALAKVDVVFPLLHGPWGEDGTIQGLLELASIPYVGSGVYASAASMDKVHMKAAFRAAGLPVGPYQAVTAAQWQRDREGVLARLRGMHFPVFVKPARAGSSIGITKVDVPEDLERAVEFAHVHDPKVVVEEAIGQAREIECAVMVQRDGKPRASVLGEIKVHPDHDFYDFGAKYLDDGADLVVPAVLEPALTRVVQETAIAAFEALDCEGLARVDFFVRDDGEVIINEVNTMPGFTPISMFPRLWAASGVAYPELIDILISDALRRGTGLR